MLYIIYVKVIKHINYKEVVEPEMDVLTMFYFKNQYLTEFHEHYFEFVKICLNSYYSSKSLLLKVSLITELCKAYENIV